MFLVISFGFSKCQLKSSQAVAQDSGSKGHLHSSNIGRGDPQLSPFTQSVKKRALSTYRLACAGTHRYCLQRALSLTGRSL